MTLGPLNWQLWPISKNPDRLQTSCSFYGYKNGARNVFLGPRVTTLFEHSNHEGLWCNPFTLFIPTSRIMPCISTLVGVNPHMYPFVSIHVLKNTYRVKVNNSKAQRNPKMKSESKQIWVCIEMMNVQVLRVEHGKKTCHTNVQNPMPQAIPNIT